jgi:retinol dehydrogenase 12
MQLTEVTIEAVENATGYNKAELWLLDLSSFASVLSFTDKIEQDGGKIDIFVANAGVAWPHYVRTVDGWEES